jgi:hypothetical protein
MVADHQGRRDQGGVKRNHAPLQGEGRRRRQLVGPYYGEQ